jgi:serine/threonine protein kinase
MSRASKPPRHSFNQAARSGATVDVTPMGEAALVKVTGLVDERFLGFGNVGASKIVVISVSGMTRMTSFGVRQWLKAMDALPKTITDLYLLGCPTFFVDQLNMVLNFGGAAKVLTVLAPFTCPACGIESGETTDVMAERANLAKGILPDKECARCSGKLEFDETPESYFAFVNKYGATSIQPAAAQMLAHLGLYFPTDTAAEKPPRIIKLVHGSVTYFRIIGTIGAMFRARPFLVGAEGEVVIDLAEVEQFTSDGHKEWRRLIKSLTNQVPVVTLVDVDESFLAVANDTLTIARNITVASVLVPYRCVDCGRTSRESASLEGATWPLQLRSHVCPTCGGKSRSGLSPERLLPLQKATTSVPPASAKVIAARDEILSRALTDANVAQAGDAAVAAVSADDTILGKYKIVRRLSQGGMAEVFIAKQVGIGGFEKTVALKRIQRKLLETRHLAIELFLNEAKIAGRLTHPNIVQVLDVGEVQGALYLAMEYVHGKDLGKIIKKLQQTRTIMALGEACYVVREVAQALHHAYWSTDMSGKQLAVVHRDISPQNIILGYDGTVKLLDFGVAVSAVTEQAETMVVGKWLYMSPEATANEQVDHRSDLFSLGVILYLLCSGQLPFTGREPREIVKKIRAGQYKPLQEIVAVPDRLAVLISRLLSPHPDDRPQRGQEVAAELADIARQHGIESSGAAIVYILNQLFQNEGTATGETQASNVRELVMGPQDTVNPTAGAPEHSGPVTAGPRSRELSVPVPSVPSVPMSASTPMPRPRAASTAPPVTGSISPVPVPMSRQYAAQATPLPTAAPQMVSPPVPSAPMAAPQMVSPPIPRPNVTTPTPVSWQSVMPPIPTSPERSVSFLGVVVTIAIVVLLAAGLFLLVRPS